MSAKGLCSIPMDIIKSLVYLHREKLPYVASYLLSLLRSSLDSFLVPPVPKYFSPNSILNKFCEKGLKNVSKINIIPLPGEKAHDKMFSPR